MLRGFCHLALACVICSTSFAADLTVESGQSLTTNQDIGSDSEVLVESGGSITISPLAPGTGAIIGTDDNSVLNYGTISALDGGAGIDLENRNSIINYGVIETSARSSNLSSEDAVHFDGDDNSLINYGTIRVFDSINGYGVHIVGGNRNIIANYGSIETTGQGSNAVHVETTGNTIINHGSITTEGLTGDGIYIVGGNSFINSGTLISLNDSAIHLHDSDSEVYLLAGSAVYGSLHLHHSSDHTFDIGNGLHAMLTFQNYLPATINTNGMPAVTDATALQLAVVDPTGFAMAEDLLADITGQAFGSVSSRLRSARSGLTMESRLSSNLTVAPAADILEPRDPETGVGTWASLFGVLRNQSASGITWGAEQQLHGITGGADLWWSPNSRAGAFAGMAKSDLEVDDEAQTITPRLLPCVDFFSCESRKRRAAQEAGTFDSPS
jgi:hypothetical protein